MNENKEIKLGDIDRNLRPLKPNIFLCRPDKKTIGKISEAYDVEYSTKLGAINKLSFKMPILLEKDRVLIRNPNIEKIKHRYLFKIKLGASIEYFVFYDESKNYGDNEEYIQYEAYSLGFQLADKMIRRYEEDSVSLREIVTEFLKYTNWKIGYIDSVFEIAPDNRVKRSFEVYSQTVLQSLYDVAEKFNALLVWDTKNLKVNFYRPENIGLNKGFYVSDWKYLESFNLNSNAEETVTRLRLYGNEELTIRSLSPTGSDYIEDYSWYMYPFKRDSNGNITKESYYMSNELCIALEDYQELLNSIDGQFGALSDSLIEMQGNIQTEEQNLSKLETDLIKIMDEIDVYNANWGEPDTPEHADMVSRRLEKESQIANQENLIESLKNSKSVIEGQLDSLRENVSMENNFTSNQLKELNRYIIEKEYVNDVLVDPEDLLEEGREALRKLREPKLKLDMNIVNLLSIVESQNDWDKLSLGDIIKVKHERLGTDIQAKIIEINYNFEDNDISLLIANELNLAEDSDWMSIVYKAGNTSTIVDMDKFKWNYAEENNGTINDLINSKWDALKNAIMAGYEQQIEISERGIIVRSLEDPDSWLVIQNGFLAITGDRGNTWKHAITKDGIVGERVYGKLIAGVNLVIEDESGIWITRGSRTTIYDRNQTEVMRLGLVTDTGETECFGLLSWNDITRVAITDCEGISVSRKKDNDWDKVFWVHPTNGTLYTKDMVAESLKIVSDIGEVIIDVENGIFDLGWFKKILADGKLTTTEKIEVWTKIATIMSEYQFILEHAEQFKYSSRDDSYIFNSQNPESSRSPSSVIMVDTTEFTLKYDNLISFVSNYISIPNDYDNEIMERTDEVDRDLFVVRFKDYYDALEELKASIDNYLNYSGLNLGKFYNNLIIDAKAGFMAIRDDYSYRARLSATDGLALEKWENGVWVKKLYGALGHPDYEDGTLIAENLVTRNLRIVDGELGDKIIFDENDGITINGNNSEQIRLNANEGIAIDVGGEKRIWIGNDGLIYAKKLYVMGDDQDELIEDIDGSYISDLTVNKLKTLNSNQPQDYIHIEDNYIKMQTRLPSNNEAVTQMELSIRPPDENSSFYYPSSIWGVGDANGLNIGRIYKNEFGFHWNLFAKDSQYRKISLNDKQEDSILLETPHNIRLKGEKKIRLEVDSNNYIELSTQGLKFVGTRIDLN